MLCSRIPISALVASTVAFLGVVGLTLTLLTGDLYRDLAFENQRKGLADLLEIKTEDLLSQLTGYATDLGTAVQKNSDFRRAYRERDIPELRRVLELQFHQFFVTAGLIDLQAVHIYDSEFNPVVHVLDKDTKPFATLGVCPDLIDAAKQRRGPLRARILSGLCDNAGIASHTVVVPIGSLRVQGYLAIVSAPQHNLRRTEDALGMPVLISGPTGEELYRSDHWPQFEQQHRTLIAQYPVTNSANHHIATLSVAYDVENFIDELEHTRDLALIIAISATLLSVVIALLLLRHTMLKPLNDLTRQLMLVREDPIRLRHEVDVRGTRETRLMASTFNQMTSELHSLYEKLENMAYRDQLTALPNRNQFNARLDFMVNRKDNRQPFALLLLDLDRFKAVNDTQGHHVGDKLLGEVSQRFKETLRSTDTLIDPCLPGFSDIHTDVIARIGGDEFAVLLPNIATAENAVQIAEKLIKATGEHFHVGDETFSIGVSIGICLYPDHGEDKHTLLRRADMAMYEAKQSRHGVVIYSQELEARTHAATRLERDLIQAIENDEFSLHYQPLCRLDSGEITGAEALLRWEHPERGNIPPDEFIPLAEKSGVIQPLCSWILKQALHDCGQWQARGHAVGISVNLSAINLQDPNLTSNVEDLLQRETIRPEAVTFELTETTVMADPGYALGVLHSLSEMGLRIAIDDFGTGYSSLAYIKRLPVNLIKIDRSFIHDMANDANDFSIVRSTIALAHSMELGIVAEGVEDASTRDLLSELGCDLMQGYHLSRPMPFEAFIDWLERYTLPQDTLSAADR